MSSPTLHATQYIVKLKDHVDLDDHIQLFDSTYNNRINESPHKVTHKWTPEFANAYVGEFSAEVLENLKKSENVEYISENIRMTADDRCDITKQEDAGWGLSRINREDKLPDGSEVESVNYEYKYDASYETGSRVDIYVLDSGIYIEHNDFGGRAVWGYTVQDGATDDDCDGHGTHVAGIAGGKRWGVAKDVALIAVKVEDDEGNFSVQDAVNGMEWILRRFKSSKRPSIVNMSHGVPRRNRFWNENVTKLVKNGIHVVVAAGNKNWDARNTSPASAALVNTVGATNIKDERYTKEHKTYTSGSNYGPCVDFFAPGQDITSCGLYKDKKKDPDATAVKTGTSMSAPVVSGIIATFISLNGDRPPLMMTNILRTLCVRQGVVASSIPDSITTRAFIQGALHVEAEFRLKAQSGTLRLVEATPVFDLSTFRGSIGTMPDHGIGNKLKDDGSAFIRKKLESISIFSRGILSKVEEGADVYNANVSVFDAVKIECNFNDGVCYDCTIPFMIVGTYPAIDVAVGHARDAEDDSETDDDSEAENDAEAYATVTFNETSYVNDKLLTYDEGSDKGEYIRYLNEVIFKACLLRAIK